MALTERPPFDATLERVGPAAAHIASVARALHTMRGAASAISTRQRVHPDVARTIERFLPDLARRYDLDAELELRGEVLTVTFTRSTE